MEWSTVLERARRTGTERQLRVGLRLAAVLRDDADAVPAAVASEGRADGRIDALVDEICRSFRANPIRDVSGATQADRAYYFLRACDSIPEALTAAYYSLPIHPDCVDYEANPLPTWLFPFYYLSASYRALSKWPAIGRLLSRLLR
jgi:hypothetical protein